MATSPRLRALQISTALLYCLLSVGICFGFAALKPILIASGVYENKCAPGDGQQFITTCVEQEISLNNMFTWAAVGEYLYFEISKDKQELTRTWHERFCISDRPITRQIWSAYNFHNRVYLDFPGVARNLFRLGIARYLHSLVHDTCHWWKLSAFVEFHPCLHGTRQGRSDRECYDGSFRCQLRSLPGLSSGLSISTQAIDTDVLQGILHRARPYSRGSSMVYAEQGRYRFGR